MKWAITTDTVTLQFDKVTESKPLVAMLKTIGSDDPAEQMALDQLILNLGGNPNEGIAYELMQQ